MTSVLKILESLEREDGLEVSKLEKSLKLTKKLDRDNLQIAIKALSKLGIVQYINDEKLTVNNELGFIQVESDVAVKVFALLLEMIKVKIFTLEKLI